MARSRGKGNEDYGALITSYRDWLATEGKPDEVASKAIFAARMTNYGQHGHCGYTEMGINIALGGDPYYMD